MVLDMGYSSWVGGQTHQIRNANPDDGPKAVSSGGGISR